MEHIGNLEGCDGRIWMPEDIICSDDDSDDSEHRHWGTDATANDNLSRIQNFDLHGDLSHLIGKTITAPLGGGGGGELWSSSRRSDRTGNGLGRSTQSLPDTFDSDFEPYDYRANTPVGGGGSISDGRSSPAGGIISLSDSTHLSEILTYNAMWGGDRPATSDRSKINKRERPQRRKTADDLHELMYGDMFGDGNAASPAELRGKLLEVQPSANNYEPSGETKRRKSLTDLAEYSDIFGMDPDFDAESSVSGVSAVSGKSAPPTLDPFTTFDQSMSKSKLTTAALEALQNSGFEIGTRGSTITMKRLHRRETKVRRHASKPAAKRNGNSNRPDGFQCPPLDTGSVPTPSSTIAPFNNNAPARHSELTAYMSVPTVEGPAMTNAKNMAATMAAPTMNTAPAMNVPAMETPTMTDPSMSGSSMSGSTLGGQSMPGSAMGGPSMSGQTTMLGPTMFGQTMMGPSGSSMAASSMPVANSMMAQEMSAPQTTNPSLAMAKLHNSMVRTSFSQHLLQEYDRANVSSSHPQLESLTACC